MKNSIWKVLSDSDSSLKFNSRMLTVWYTTVLIFIFIGYDYLIRINLIEKIIIPILIIIIAVLFLLPVEIKYKFPLILYFISFIIYLSTENNVLAIALLIFIFVLSVIISMSVVEKYYEIIKKESELQLYYFYRWISAIILLLFTFY